MPDNNRYYKACIKDTEKLKNKDWKEMQGKEAYEIFFKDILEKINKIIPQDQIMPRTVNIKDNRELPPWWNDVCREAEDQKKKIHLTLKNVPI